MTLHKPTLLYAEDDQESRENYAYILHNDFETVYQAADGKEALRLYHEHSPDIVLLDVNMPLLDGLEVAEAIRKENQTIPIVMLTGHSDRERLLKAINLKLSAYLLKPVDIIHLLQTLKSLVASHTSYKSKRLILRGGLYYDNEKMALFDTRDKEINLTKKERMLVKTLCEKHGEFCHHDEIIYRVWSDEIPDYRHNKKLTQLVYRLNKKIAETVSPGLPLIENGYSLGYRIALP